MSPGELTGLVEMVPGWTPPGLLWRGRPRRTVAVTVSAVVAALLAVLLLLPAASVSGSVGVGSPTVPATVPTRGVAAHSLITTSPGSPSMETASALPRALDADLPRRAPGRLAEAAPADPDRPADASAAATQEGEAAHGAGEEEGPHIPHVFLVLIAILLLGKLLGEAAERMEQPAVLGELIAGVILGGSVLGVIPGPETPIGEIVHVLAEIGVAILLFEIGLETDLKEMFRVGPAASAVALVGVVLPFGLGFGYWYLANPQISAHPQEVEFWIVAIFVGATLTATSVGITARVLSDLDRMHTPEARIIIGAAVIDDVLGIVILAIVASLATGAAVTFLGISKIFLLAFGFLIAAVVVGQWLAPTLFDLVDRMRVRGVLLVSAFCFALLLAALADIAGSAMIIGAFAAGIVLSSTNQFDAVVDRIEPVADVFTPIFFVWVGAPVNVDLLIPGTEDFSVAVLTVGGILTVIAILGKLVSGWAVRQDDVSKTVVGVGMVPRGEVGLIFAAVGLSSGVLSNEVYSAILIMVMASTFVVPPVLKVLFEREAPEEPRGGKPAVESVPGTEA